MKKLLLTAAVLVTCFVANAQYFQHVYGVPVNETLTSGINTTASGDGYFMASSNSGFAFGTASISATFADVAGNIPGGPYFTNEYMVVSNAGNPLQTQDPQVFEYNNGSGFGIIGRYTDPTMANPNTGIYFLQLDPSGNVLNSFDYTVNPNGGSFWDVIKVSAIAESASGKEIYITGWLQPNFAQVNSFVLKVDASSGAIIWGYVYDVINPSFSSKDLFNDIVESPYGAEVIVVGQTYDGTTTSDGLFMRINSNTGAAFPVVNLHGTATSWDAFNAITVANSPSAGGPGFAIGGTSNTNGTNDFWFTLVDPTGTFITSTLHDYSINPGANDNCEDIIERKNTAGKFEYYMAGSTFKGAFGKYDVLVIKTDAKGNGVANGEFTYGSAGNDFGKSLDQYNGTNNDGLSVFGTYDDNIIGGSDMYLVRAYFNGASGCNEKFNTPTPKNGPKLYLRYDVKDIAKFKDDKFSWKQTGAKEKTLCFAWSITGGNNARVAPEEPKGDKEAKISPNPIAQGIQYASFEVEVETPTTAQVAIYDMLGRSYYTQTFTLVKGNNSLMLDISNANMAPGMYTVKIQGDNLNKNIVWLVK